MMHTVFVLSDFGCRDTYGGQMKAALLKGLGGAANIIDLSNCIPPGDIRNGAFNLMVSMPSLPSGSGILAVVDPGVGTSRRALAAYCAGRIIVGPDNGLLSWVELDRVYVLPETDTKRSSTFHGRDFFAPALARALADPEWVGSLAGIDPSDIVRLPAGSPECSGGTVEVPVAHVDCFGNCILWLRWSDLGGREPVSLRNPRGSSFTLRSTDTYGPARPGLLLLEGSCGFLEVALSGGSAAFFTGVSEGDTVTISLQE
jgi:S-adenosylmethionine hydrolase